MLRISLFQLTGSSKFLRQLRIAVLIAVIRLKAGSKELLVLGQEAAAFLTVTGFGLGLDAEFAVHIGGNALVDGHIFLGKIVVVPVVGIEMFQLSAKELHSQTSAAAVSHEIDILLAIGDPLRQRIGQQQGEK